MKRGVNRGIEIRQSVSFFFLQIRWSANVLVQIRNHNHIRKHKCKSSKVNWSWNVNTIVNFAQIVKKATSLMTLTQYNSNNSLTPEFKWASFENNNNNNNNLDELINIPSKVEAISVIQILFSPQDPNIKADTMWDPRQNSQLIHDPLCFQNPRIRSIYRKSPQPVRFLRPNPSIPKPIQPPLWMISVDFEDSLFQHDY